MAYAVAINSVVKEFSMGCFAYFLNSLLYSLFFFFFFNLKSQFYRINTGSTNVFHTYRDKRDFKVPTFGDKVPVNPIDNNVLQRNNTYKHGQE